MVTSDYNRGYAKGRYTGEKKADAALAVERERARQAAERAERAESRQGLGHCEDCRYWVRGGGVANWQACAWGVCKAPRSAGTPCGTWAVASGHQIQTTPRFGCVQFSARKK